MDTKQLTLDAITMMVGLLDSRGPLGDAHSAIESHLYLAMGSDIDRFNMAKGLANSQGWVTSRSHVLTLTPKGVAKARQIQAMLDEAR